MAAGLQARTRPALETGEEQRKAYRQFDIVLVIVMFFLFMGLYHIVAMLTVGDWDFWVDWKDRRWWILLTPVILISMPAAVQYIFWEKFRLPLAATLLTLCLALLRIDEAPYFVCLNTLAGKVAEHAILIIKTSVASVREQFHDCVFARTRHSGDRTDRNSLYQHSRNLCAA
jgi:hypothetical protein